MDKKEISRKAAIVSMIASEKRIPIAYLKGITSEEISKLIEDNPTEALLALKDSIIVGEKKIEGYMVCPLCGNHKKLQKAPKDGIGTNIRLIKRKWAEEYCKLEEKERREKNEEESTENSKHCVPPFAIRYEQERLKKNLMKRGKDILSMANELIEETSQNLVELVRSIGKDINLAQELQNRLEEFFIGVEEFDENGNIIEFPILRQPFFENGENPADQKLLSIRINFGNPYAGKTKKFLLYIRALLRFKNITETILRGKLATVIIPELVEKMTTPEIKQLEELLFEKTISPSFAPTEEEAPTIENIRLNEETGEIEETEESNEGENPPLPPIDFTDEGLYGEYGRITKEQLKRIEQALQQMSLEELKEKLIKVGNLSPQEVEDIIDKRALVIDKLFPKFIEILELKGGIVSGFAELEEITLSEAIAIIKLIKSSSFERIMMIIKATRKTLGLDLSKDELRRETIDFLIFISYLYTQVKRLKQFAENMLNYITKQGL